MRKNKTTVSNQIRHTQHSDVALYVHRLLTGVVCEYQQAAIVQMMMATRGHECHLPVGCFCPPERERFTFLGVPRVLFDMEIRLCRQCVLLPLQHKSVSAPVCDGGSC